LEEELSLSGREQLQKLPKEIGNTKGFTYPLIKTLFKEETLETAGVTA
jgi:hypothetical protein